MLGEHLHTTTHFLTLAVTTYFPFQEIDGQFVYEYMKTFTGPLYTPLLLNPTLAEVMPRLL